MDTEHLKLIILALYDEKGDDIYDFLLRRAGIEYRDTKIMMDRFVGDY